jgi:hypothetical protein
MSLTRQLPVLIFWASAQQHPQSIIFLYPGSSIDSVYGIMPHEQRMSTVSLVGSKMVQRRSE